MGHWRYLLFYGAGAVTATLVFDAFYDGEPTILIGASGAVSATLGAFLVLFHDAKIKIWYWLFIRYTGTFEVAAYVALPLWFADQMFWAFLQGEGFVTSVAHTAHIGGFAFGFAVAYAMHLMTKPEVDVLESAGTVASKRLPRAVVVKQSSTKGKPPLASGGGQATSDQGKALDTICTKALEDGDWATLEENASALLVKLAKHDRYDRILEIYLQIQKGNPSFSFTDEALANVARAADKTDSVSVYLSCAAQLVSQHPESSFVPGTLWRVAELHRLQGHADLADKALRELVEGHPEHYFAAKAIDQLGGGD